MLQWATKILQTCETLCLDVQCQKWTNSLRFQFTDQRLDLKVSSGLHRSNLLLLILELLALNEEVSYATHFINWNRFIIKMFLSKCTWGFFLPSDVIDWMSLSCRENQNINLIWIFYPCVTDWEHITLKLIFTSCFLSWLQQTCVSEGRQLPPQLPAQKWQIFIIGEVFLEMSKHWLENENICCLKISPSGWVGLRHWCQLSQTLLGFCFKTKPAVDCSSGRFHTFRSLVSQLFIWIFFFFFWWINILSFNNPLSYFIWFVFLHRMTTGGQHLHHEFTWKWTHKYFHLYIYIYSQVFFIYI